MVSAARGVAAGPLWSATVFRALIPTFPPPIPDSPGCQDKGRAAIHNRDDECHVRERHMAASRSDAYDSAAIWHDAIGIGVSELFCACFIANPLQRVQR